MTVLKWLLKGITKGFQTVMLVMIRGYQRFISPLFPRTCRFYPTCSAYCYEAIRKYGPFKGGLLGLKRLLRCHPFNPGGYDPVP